MPSHRKNWFEGWRLFAVLTLVLIVAMASARTPRTVRAG
jgi:hypothetical protein